jgi:cytochrome c oxidase subunit 2
LVLPIDAKVQFLVNARDVIHSLWIPAFRVKIDAVPGLTTSVKATPNTLGTYEKDVNFRLQCAELCGAGHAVMRMPVRVVEQAEFDEWISEQRPISARR